MTKHYSTSQLKQMAFAAIQHVTPIFIEHFTKKNAVSFKCDRDPVTEIDIQIEREIELQLRNATPEIPVKGEESWNNEPDDLYWVIDPIDGTANYTNQIPTCGISISLVENNIPIIGAINLPLFNEIYLGAHGEPPTLNGKIIQRADSFLDLKSCTVALGDYGHSVTSEAKNKSRLILHEAMAKNSYRVRMIGSAATDLAWTSTGKFGASITLSNNPWDMAAGALIAKTSGCQVTDIFGNEYTTNSKSVVVSICKPLHDIIIAETCKLAI